MATTADETTLAPDAGRPEGFLNDGRIDRALLTVAGVVVLGTVMSILDTTVVNVAINTLAQTFHTTLPTIQWVATGYTLALATVIPLSGWIADRFGTKRLYMSSIALFVIGSALSGLAQSSTEIIVFRVLQGLGGGMIMPAGMTILTRAAGPHRIGRVMAIIGVPMLLGPILGPVIGGWLVSDVSWRWIFFINAPLGVIALIAAFRVLPRDVAALEERLDLIDLLLASPGLALLIYGLAKSDPGGFGQAKVLIPIGVGVLLLIAFVAHALRATNPLIDLRLFRNRVFSASSVALALMVVSVFGSFLLLPLYLQEVRGESALHSGLLLIPQGLGSMLMMPIAGILSDKTGSGRIVPFGLILIGASVLWLTGVGAHTAYWKLEIDLFINGIGMGLTMMPIFTGAIQTITAAAAARASALLNIIQQAGASIGTAILTVLLAAAITHRLGGHATGAGEQLSAAVRARVAAPMAAAFGSTFWWALALIGAAFIASLFLPKHRPENAASGPPVMM
ncbi:DHA2 family efflux MFS transporter permease subunit [Conexibacter sp. DBS9H8]|uniref:DHA2 family efflux MFS transporter permease subunit n=1 Tax=Conexibacter sp. DBS9H8 TaxID=2937801 RepID=UPI00200D68EE|nr:DHA2 family efflux MFS transporter permease subunit [Conexibacter sp. DBS9H8]